MQTNMNIRGEIAIHIFVTYTEAYTYIPTSGEG
jgi:hypothetical protein